MEKHLPFFNWSLKKALATEADSFGKARIRIVITVLIFSLLKAAIVVGIGIANAQWLQVTRAGVAFVIYVSLGKILLYRPSRLNLLAHIMLFVGIFIVWTNIFVYAHKVNLVTIQFVFLIALCSFYTLGSRWGTAYSFMSILPVVLFLAFGGTADITFTGAAQEFASPGFEIIVVLNFVSIVLLHYLFYEALNLNIKEKEELNEELQISVAKATKLAESRANFLSTISHELRTPLNSVIGTAELLIDDRPEERQKENLKILQYSALDLLSLINNVLDFNKIDSDKLVLEASPFRLAEFMENICLGLRIKANDKRLSFVLDIDTQLNNVNIVSDSTRLSQLIYNLVSNAIKFTDKGCVMVKLECKQKTPGSVDVLFSVTDTGIGIHPEKHDKIFELFTQAETHTTRKYGGTGLGLAIVKQVLALFNSTVQLESSPGNGARFFFTIPFITTAESPAKTKPSSGEKTDLGYLNILIAEDNNFNRLIIKRQFQLVHIDPYIVENGKLAYEAFMSGSFDAVFIDLHMPVQDGYETARQIRASAAAAGVNVYLVAFTASINEQEKIFENGFDDFLYKPVEMSSLRDKLELIAEFKTADAVENPALPSNQL